MNFCVVRYGSLLRISKPGFKSGSLQSLDLLKSGPYTILHTPPLDWSLKIKLFLTSPKKLPFDEKTRDKFFYYY